MDNKLKKIIKISFILISLIAVSFISVLILLEKSSLNFYVVLVKISLILITFIFIFFAFCFYMIIFAYQKKQIGRKTARITFFCINFIRPFLIFIATILKINNEEFKSFFIELNNIVVNSYGIKFKSENILAIMPHCLQNFDCNIKITGDVNRCKKCGKCSIAKIITICERLNVKLEVVTGGTAARNIVKKNRPKLIVAVACERDLLQGIVDVGIIPVFGLVNRRPNGPCFNTEIDTSLFEQKLTNILKK